MTSKREDVQYFKGCMKQHRLITSQRCSICRDWLCNEDDANGKKIWALKRCAQCRSSRGGDLYRNRDRNASLNILQVYLSLAESGLRPPEFDFLFKR